MNEQEVEDFIQKIGDRVRVLRSKQSLTLLELASRSGLDIRQVQRLEANENTPTLRTLCRIIRGLGMTFPEFFEFDTERSVEKK